MLRRIVVNQNRKGNSSDESHNNIKNIVREATFSQSIINKRPLNPIIGIFHVKIHSKTSFISLFIVLDILKTFIGKYGVIYYEFVTGQNHYY